MNDIETFVILKYEILTSNSDTWKRCESTYPAEVKSKWAWRCAADVEHLAKGYPEAEECIRIAKLCRDGKATMEELDKAWQEVPYSAYTNSAYYAADGKQAARAAFYAALAAANASYHSGDNVDISCAVQKEKWNLYGDWLVEELCEYESTKENSNGR